MDVLWQELGGGKESPTPGKLLVAMAEVVLGKRAVESAAYQTSVTICAGCSRTWQRAGGEQVEVSDAVAGCARCDGEVVGLAEVPAEDDVLAEEGGARPTWVMGPGHDVEPQRDPRGSCAHATHGATTHVGHAHAVVAATHDARGTTHVGHEAAALQHLRELATRAGPGRCCG
jgi:hypothetical protein